MVDFDTVSPFVTKLVTTLHDLSPIERADTLAVLESVLEDLKTHGTVHCAGCGRTSLNGECGGF